MTVTRRILGALLVLTGVVWIGQGLQLIQGSAMTGSTFWAVMGALCVAGGLLLLGWPWRQPRERSLPGRTIQSVDPSADNGSMTETSLEDLRRELADLEAEEALLSATRNHLQHQIDFGFETSTARDREREVSDQRQELHRRIDALRERLRGLQGV